MKIEPSKELVSIFKLAIVTGNASLARDTARHLVTEYKLRLKLRKMELAKKSKDRRDAQYRNNLTAYRLKLDW